MTFESHSVVRASPADLPWVLSLLKQCGLPDMGVADGFDRFWVARANGRAIACAGLEAHGDFGLLRSVAVEPTARRRELGTALVRAVVAAARELGLRGLFLLTTSSAAFFERLGFAGVARESVPASIAGSWQFSGGCPHSARALALVLSGPECRSSNGAGLLTEERELR